MRRPGAPWCWPLIALVLAGCASSQKSAPPATIRSEEVSRPSATPTVLQGERLLSEGKPREALRVLRQAVADDPKDARAWLDVGLASEEVGDTSAAEQAYRRAVDIDPRFPDPLNNLGVLLREAGELDQAIDMLELAAAIDPALAAARFNLALAYEDQSRLEEAEREYRAVIERLPDDPVPRINLAMMLLEMGRSEAAAEELRAASSMVRRDVLLSIAVGEGLRRAGLPEEAVPVLRNALEIAAEPPPTELLAELALAHYATGDLEWADAAMRRALRQDELDPALQYAYGSILAKRGDLGQARVHLRRAIELDPDGPYAAPARARLEAIK